MRKLLIVGEHPKRKTGFGNLHRELVNTIADFNEFDEVTSLGVLTHLGTKLDDSSNFISINNADYLTTDGNMFGRDSIVKFLSENTDYTDVLCIGDPWYYDGLPYTKAIFGSRVAFHYYCPAEGGGLPTHVTSNSSKMGNKIDIQRIIKSFDQVIAYSNFGMNSIKSISPDNVSDYVYHWTKIPSVKPEPIPALEKAIAGRKVVGFIGRNVYRKATDNLLRIAELLKGTDIVILAHCPKHDVHGWDIDHIAHMYPDAWDNIIFTQDYIPGLYYERRGNSLYPSMSAGLKQEHMEWLYTKFDIFLNLSRGEGFGFPIIEAMVRGVPTMVNNYATPGEIMQLVEGKPNIMCINTLGEDMFWSGACFKLGRPDYEEIASRIKSFFPNKIELLKSIGEEQQRETTKMFTKNHSEHPRKLLNLIMNFKHPRKDNNYPIVVESHMERCGIRTYTDNLFGKKYKHRIQEKNLDAIVNSISNVKGKTFHIQYEPGLWGVDSVARFIDTIKLNNNVVVTVHTENEDFFTKVLGSVDLFIFHKEPTKVKLDPEQYVVINHPIPSYPTEKSVAQVREELGFGPEKIVIGINGFVTTYKKVLEQALSVIQLIQREPEKYALLMVCSPHGSDVLNSGKRIISKIEDAVFTYGVDKHVKIIYDFLPGYKMNEYLSAMNFALMFHNVNSVGAQSGSVRELIAAGVMPIVTRSEVQTMHNDLISQNAAIAIQMPESKPISIEQFNVGAIAAIEQYGESEQTATVRKAIKEYAEQNTFDKMLLTQYNKIRRK